MAMKFLTKWVIEPMDNLNYAFRNVLDKMGILKPLDDFIYSRLEDPFFYILFSQLYKFKAYNEEAIPKEGPVIIVSNHQSIMDPLVMGLAVVHNSRRIPYQLAKAELYTDPFLNNFTRLNKGIFIRRGDSDITAMDECKKVLNEGHPLVYYPEGTTNEGNGKMIPFKTGVCRLAWDTKATILPAAIYGSDMIYGHGAKMPKNKGVLRVKFGEVVPLEKLFKTKENETPDQDEFDKVAKKLQREVGKLWTDLWMEATNEAKAKEKDPKTN
jgi:1-acyl-sn-glycerol-3-phosphate acyltransferase